MDLSRNPTAANAIKRAAMQSTLRRGFLGSQHQFQPLAQVRPALLGGRLAPFYLRALGSLDGTPCFRSAALRHVGNFLAVGRVEDCKGFAAVGITPFAVDECLVSK